RRDLPMPASPRTSRHAGIPCSTRASSSNATARSRSRPTSGGVRTVDTAPLPARSVGRFPLRRRTGAAHDGAATTRGARVMDVQGHCDERFAGVAREFERNFAERGELGASVAVTVGGETVVDLWGGRAYPDSD